MRKSFIIACVLAVISTSALFLFSFRSEPRAYLPTNTAGPGPKGCVFKTVYEGEGLDPDFTVKTPAEVVSSESHAYDYMVTAQNNDGGFAAGSHAHQEIMDPHAASSDPATTAMVSMALLRAGSTPATGKYAQVLARTTEFILKAIENSPDETSNITDLQGTQIQIKLGQNIDVALASQYISNLIGRMPCNDPAHSRWLNAQNKCVRKIQHAQASNGSAQGSGWAGVLQSSFAANALESAQHAGGEVDDKALRKARDFQKGNFDANTGAVALDMAAGVTLYAVSSSTRSSAKEAREADERMEKAKKEGKLAADAPVTVGNLEQAGFSKDEAEHYNTAHQVYNAAKARAQSNDVISGFGNNGGEEFLSFLQTGESLIINKDNSWKNWYESTTARLVEIQNNDGSWNGHHCITSPVFCTATALLILSVNNDIEALVSQGATTGKRN